MTSCFGTRGFAGSAGFAADVVEAGGGGGLLRSQPHPTNENDTMDRTAKTFCFPGIPYNITLSLCNLYELVQPSGRSAALQLVGCGFCFLR
jgi:hypothetical protein